MPNKLLALAPVHLTNHRKIRYAADDQCISLNQLNDRDQTLLRDLYERLSELLYLIADTAKTDSQRWQAVRGWTQQHNLDRCIDEVREIGLASGEANSSEDLAKAMHDVRGGALGALFGRLQILDYLPTQPGDLNTIFVLARDHLKIMRNALVGLDDARRDADRQPKAHQLAMMLDKWQAAAGGPLWKDRPIRLEIDCYHEGPLTECCLESAAIDRTFYNLVSNASRHSTDGQLKVSVFPLPDLSDHCLRFVFSNPLNETDAARLRKLIEKDGVDSTDKGFGQSLFPLFEPKVSSLGSGYGLTIVADFVTEAFGLGSRKQALQERYIGAVLDGQIFHAWFHWPMANGDLPAKEDDYRHPQQSLSEPASDGKS